MGLNFSKRNKGESKREYAARKLGGKPSDYNSDGKKKNSNNNKKNSNNKSDKDSKSEKAEKKTAKKETAADKADIETKARLDTEKLANDTAQALRDAGIQLSRAGENYLNSITNINNNKAADRDDIANYVATQKGRTQEDLDASLARETRRYEIEYDKTNQNLADTGLTFSERKQEKVDAQGNAMNVAGTNLVANRSFQDIARLEATKNRDIELKYGQLTQEAEATKSRTIEDIINENSDIAQNVTNSQAYIDLNKSSGIRNNAYAGADAIKGIDNDYARSDSFKAIAKENSDFQN